MTEPKRMGIDLPTGTSQGPRQIHCPGAMLRLTSADYWEMHNAGTPFVTGSKEIRKDGYSDARVFCRDDVALIRVASGKEGGREDGRDVMAIYHAALCSACSQLERNNRADLAARKAKAGSDR
jgi:hypothetical protein